MNICSDSHHAINNKYSIIGTLLHRARNICSNKELLEEEQTIIQKALTACTYPNWAINRMKLKIDAPKIRQNRNNKTTCRSHITVPYDEGLSETIKNIGKKYGIQVHFKCGKTLKDELAASKDIDHMTNKSGIIYRFKCDRLVWWRVYWWDSKNIWSEVKRTPKSPLPYLWPQWHHWSHYQHQQLQYSGQRRAKPLQADKRINVH